RPRSACLFAGRSPLQRAAGPPAISSGDPARHRPPRHQHGTDRATNAQSEALPRSGDDLFEMSGEGPALALSIGAGSGRRSRPLPEARADQGAAYRPLEQRLARGPTESVAEDDRRRSGPCDIDGVALGHRVATDEDYDRAESLAIVV